MKLPNAEAARIDLKKLRDYILSETHPIGGPKARFFREIGITAKNMDVLNDGLLSIAKREGIVDSVQSPYGTKYVVDGFFQAPTGVRVRLRTVWIIEQRRKEPRFVTVYPAA